MSKDIFDRDADQARYDRFCRDPGPDRQYAIFFTPRSGSSWLTSVLTDTKFLGNPAEWFNPRLMQRSTRAKGARNLDQFVNVISRHRIYGGIFGFEITYQQLKAVFKTEENFASYFKQLTYFWLIREDIVAQAVSLDKKIQTKMSHAPNHSVDEIAQSDAAYDYSPTRIKRWANHIRTAEVGTERMFARFDIEPIRLSYEQITSSDVGEVVARFTTALGITDPVLQVPKSDHEKIGSARNVDYAVRFRTEMKSYVDQLDADRQMLLSRLKAAAGRRQ